MTELVRWVVGAFMSNPDADHDELVAILRGAGVPRAHHAVAILPIAFGRQILDKLVPELPDTYELDGKTVAYADDPIFAAARELARSATREEIQRIGLGSAEVNAVNAALDAGSKPEDLVLSPTMIKGDPAEPEVEMPTAAQLLAELVAGHDVTLALEARIFPSHVMPGRVQHQLDVIASVGDRHVVESFAGLGDTVKASLGDAFMKFVRGSFHVLLATLVGKKHGHDQVEYETFGEFELCSGPLLRLWAADAPAVDFAALLDAIKAKLTGLSRDLHWFRIFIAIGDDGKPFAHFDALLDNQSYAPVVELLSTWPWPRGERPYALRHFFTLVPADPPA